MPDWALCPHCGLRHTRRPDGNCPRCKQSVDGGAASTEATDAAAPGAPMPEVYDGRPSQPPRYAFEKGSSSSSEVPTGARIAGGVLLLNALALVAEKVLAPGADTSAMSTGAPMSALFDLVIGGALVAGSEKFLIWAKVRAAIGGIVLPLIHLYTGNGLLAGIQLVFSAGILLLLLGEAGKLRIGAGIAAAGLCLGLEFLGLAAIKSGSNPMINMVLSRQVEKEAVKVVEGEKFRYRVTSPNDKWFLRKADLAKKDNPLADRWLVRPDRDAHLMVLAEEVPGTGFLDMERFATVVLDNARKSVTGLVVIEQKSLPHTLPNKFIHTRGKVQGMDIETYYGLFIRDRILFQVLGFANQSGFPGVESELQQLIKSFESS